MQMCSTDHRVEQTAVWNHTLQQRNMQSAIPKQGSSPKKTHENMIT